MLINQRAYLQKTGALRVSLLALLGTLLTLTSFAPKAFAQQAPTIINEPPRGRWSRRLEGGTLRFYTSVNSDNTLSWEAGAWARA